MSRRTRARVNEIYAGLDPVALLRDIRAVQEQLANLTDAAPASHPTAMSPIEQFLSSLQIAWKDGAGRPNDRPIAKSKRERRRPDPLVKATYSYANGSRPSRGGPAANSCPSFRQKTSGSTRRLAALTTPDHRSVGFASAGSRSSRVRPAASDLCG